MHRIRVARRIRQSFVRRGHPQFAAIRVNRVHARHIRRVGADNLIFVNPAAALAARGIKRHCASERERRRRLLVAAGVGKAGAGGHPINPHGDLIGCIFIGHVNRKLISGNHRAVSILIQNQHAADVDSKIRRMIIIPV